MRFKSKLVLVLVFIIMSFSAFAAKSNKKEDVKMPNIVLYDQYGKKHNIEEYKGKVVVINFWATWCGYCVQEMPEFEKVYKEFGSNKKNVIILGVAGPKSKENQNITYPSLMDETGKSFDDYKVRALPMTYVINKDGYLEGFVSGAITSEQLRKAVNETLKKK